MYSNKQILDVCCGGRMFYENKQDERVLFCDKRAYNLLSSYKPSPNNTLLSLFYHHFAFKLQKL